MTVQGYLAHKETPNPGHPPRTLGIGLRCGPRGVQFLISDVPLYSLAAGAEDAVDRNGPITKFTLQNGLHQ